VTVRSFCAVRLARGQEVVSQNTPRSTRVWRESCSTEMMFWITSQPKRLKVFCPKMSG